LPEDRAPAIGERSYGKGKHRRGSARSSTSAWAGAGTRLVFTEQAVFLDGYDDAGSREHGTNWLLDKLGEALKTETARA
jgi:hypothetical protein